MRPFAASLSLFLGLLAGCGQNAAPPRSEPLKVKVQYPARKSVPDYTYFTGRTASIESVEVRARVTGYLVAIDFEAGKEVKTGQRLFKIDPRPYKAVLDQAKAQVALAEAKLKLAMADLERSRGIAKTPGAISQQDLDRYLAAQGEAEAAVVAAKANAESAELDYKFTDVLSPIDGIVGRNLITLGNLVSMDKTLLTTIVSADPMYAYFDVDERTMLRAQQRIREGKMESARKGVKLPVQLGLATDGNDYPHEGYLDFVDNQIDATTGTINVRGVFPNPLPENDGPRLLTPGLFVRIRLPMGEPQPMLVVPVTAIGTDQDKRFVLVVNDQDVVEYRPVKLGPDLPDGQQAVEPVLIVRTERGIQLGEGKVGQPSLTDKDRVIVSGLLRVRPGMTVAPAME
jgi:RND family efflux transporter MFP subunit